MELSEPINFLNILNNDKKDFLLTINRFTRRPFLVTKSVEKLGQSGLSFFYLKWAKILSR